MKNYFLNILIIQIIISNYSVYWQYIIILYLLEIVLALVTSVTLQSLFNLKLFNNLVSKIIVDDLKSPHLKTYKKILDYIIYIKNLKKK